MHACSIRCPDKKRWKDWMKWWISSLRCVCTCNGFSLLRPSSSVYHSKIRFFITDLPNGSNSLDGSLYVLTVELLSFQKQPETCLLLSVGAITAQFLMPSWGRGREGMCPVDHHTSLAQTGSKHRLQVTGPTYYKHLLDNGLLYGIVSLFMNTW